MRGCKSIAARQWSERASAAEIARWAGLNAGLGSRVKHQLSCRSVSFTFALSPTGRVLAGGFRSSLVDSGLLRNGRSLGFDISIRNADRLA
ncbi:unnamed protein product [Lasius platythorax]|uniref:Uncharacterized protein n=1 Tax=Lasius platythorax TaxID=488582 RepID=A0AAV2N0D5_9HYME